MAVNFAEKCVSLFGESDLYGILHLSKNATENEGMYSPILETWFHFVKVIRRGSIGLYWILDICMH